MSLTDQTQGNYMCGCIGKQGNDPYCPCEMRQRGLAPTGFVQPMTPAEKDRLVRMFNKYEIK